jgi:hypothetical protein
MWRPHAAAVRGALRSLSCAFPPPSRAPGMLMWTHFITAQDKLTFSSAFRMRKYVVDKTLDTKGGGGGAPPPPHASAAGAAATIIGAASGTSAAPVVATSAGLSPGDGRAAVEARRRGSESVPAPPSSRTPLAAPPVSTAESAAAALPAPQGMHQRKKRESPRRRGSGDASCGGCASRSARAEGPNGGAGAADASDGASAKGGAAAAACVLKSAVSTHCAGAKSCGSPGAAYSAAKGEGKGVASVVRGAHSTPAAASPTAADAIHGSPAYPTGAAMYPLIA